MSEWGPQHFPSSFVELYLYDEPDVRNFRQLSHLFPSSLTHLCIWNFEKLESLSMGLQHLTSLQHLSIWECPKLKHLPKQLMPSLLSLEINRCPKLRKGVKEEDPTTIPSSLISPRSTLQKYMIQTLSDTIMQHFYRYINQ
ncbi:putative leucine-rich repeat domain superfamily [Helianthus annuus]|nr:putative leucine-rich repeat domain superfamily [Helianthus annuus]